MEGSAPFLFMPNADPGYWDPVAPNSTTALDPTPWVGDVKPFLMQSSVRNFVRRSTCAQQPRLRRSVNEVKAIGGDGVVTPSARNPTQTYVAKWSRATPSRAGTTSRAAHRHETHLDAADSARLLAMENLTAADAAINTWNDKYHFRFWRPFQRSEAAADGNSATEPI